MPRRSLVGNPAPKTLEWHTPLPHVHMAMVVGADRRGRPTVRFVFRTVRAMADGNGLLQGDGWVVTSPSSFADLAQCDTLEEAKTFVEGLFALEEE